MLKLFACHCLENYFSLSIQFTPSMMATIERDFYYNVISDAFFFFGASAVAQASLLPHNYHVCAVPALNEVTLLTEKKNTFAGLVSNSTANAHLFSVIIQAAASTTSTLPFAALAL